MKVEFYPSVKNRNDHKSIDLNNLLIKIKTSEKLRNMTVSFRVQLPTLTKTEKNELKVNTFSGVQFSGTFSGTGKAHEIDQLSGLFVIDFDHIDVDKYRPLLMKDPFTFILFTSPSGDGIKVILRHTLTDPDKWYYLFNELQEYYKRLIGKDIDPSGKDISRQCFICFDPNIYINRESLEWEFNEKNIQETDIQETDIQDIDDDLIQECHYLGQFFKDNNINITDSYEEWMRLGFSLCYLGESGRPIFHLISSTSGKYSKRETDSFYDTLLDRYDPTIIDIEHYRRKLMMGIARYTIYNNYQFIRQ